MFTKMTIGKKLGISLGALLALTLGLGYVAWHAVSAMGEQLDTAVNKTSVKLDLIDETGQRLNDVSVSNRGVMLGYMNHDAGFVENNIKKMDAARKRVDEQMKELRPLHDEPGGQARRG